ncbi:MAG: hypothetical protein P1V51_06750 [Deltaproteobacteria bacterium]|nr:hypothetical protein [Deltaproteobacteria bacterium]
MNAQLLRFLGLVLLLLPGLARAEVEVQTRTLLLGRGHSPGVHAEWPLYQWVEVSGHDLALPGLSAHASLWGMGGLAEHDGDPLTGERLAGDVNLLYAGYRDPRARYALRLGRQLVLGGAGTGFFGHIDGLWARTALGGLEAEAYGGRIVTARFSNLSQADWLAGGRVGWRRWGGLAGGLSYLQARNDSRIARQLVGADLSLAVWKNLDAVGHASFDLMQMGLAEASLTARYQLGRSLALGLRGHQASPSRLIDQSSIFSVFGLGDYVEGGLFCDYRLSDQWVLGAEYSSVFFPAEDGQGIEGSPGHRARLHLSGYLLRSLWVQVAADRLPTEDNGYTGVRLAARWRPEAKLSASLELLGYFYDEPPFERDATRDSSLSAHLFADYALLEGLLVGVGGQVGQGAFTTLDARLLFRLTWAAHFGHGETGKGGH